MLNCRYLRLTPNNIKMLENVCGEAGYDVSAHPHTKENVDAELLVITWLPVSVKYAGNLTKSEKSYFLQQFQFKIEFDLKTLVWLPILLVVVYIFLLSRLYYVCYRGSRSD